MDEARFEELVDHVRAELERLGFNRTPAEWGVWFTEVGVEDLETDLIRESIEWSEKNSTSWDTLCLIASRRLRREDPLTPELSAWVADVLEDLTSKGKRRPRPRRRGRPGLSPNRDAFLGDMVRQVSEEFDLTIERRRKKRVQRAKDVNLPHPCAEGGSACDVVAAAAERLGESMSYSNIAGIWHRHSRNKSS